MDDKVLAQAVGALDMTLQVNRLLAGGYSPFMGLTVCGGVLCQWMVSQYDGNQLNWEMFLASATTPAGLQYIVNAKADEGFDLYLGAVSGNGWIWQWLVRDRGLDQQLEENELKVITDVVAGEHLVPISDHGLMVVPLRFPLTVESIMKFSKERYHMPLDEVFMRKVLVSEIYIGAGS